jgi:hypothetical protein
MVSSGWQDSNLRPPHPKCGAIPGYATSRLMLIGVQIYNLFGEFKADNQMRWHLLSNSYDI